MWTDFPLLLAQDEAPPPNIGAPSVSDQTGDAQSLSDPNAGGTSAGAPAEPGNPYMPLFMLLAVGLMFVFLMGGGRREKKKKAAMLAALGKGDEVQTIGGQRGTVVQVKDDEVILKVDENTNTRIRFAKSAIQTVLESKNGEESK